MTAGCIDSTAMGMKIMKNVYDLIKKWRTERRSAKKPLKIHNIVADMLAEVVILIESTSTWTWTYLRAITCPDIYGWDSWEETFPLKTRVFSFYESNAVESACGRAMDFMDFYGQTRGFEIKKYGIDERVTGRWMDGGGLKILEKDRYCCGLESS